ncbi:MAG TPA: outer membrane beta-barrel protein [Solimonas sp.]
MLVLASSALPLAAAQAQSFEFLGENLAEGTLVRTSIEAGLTYTDNFFYTTQAAPQQEAVGWLLRPGAALTRSLSRVSYGFGANAEIAGFDVPSSVDDYQDYRLGGAINWQPASRHQLTFGPTLLWDHDPFGRERTENTPLENRELDKWRQVRGDARYRIGLPADRFNYELLVTALDKRYTSNRNFTQYLDYSSTTEDFLVTYNYSPKTAALINIVATQTDYDKIFPGAFDRSADEIRYLVGARWTATGKTSGDVRVGYAKRKSNDASRNDFSGLDWRAGVSWTPVAYRGISASIGRSSQESYFNNVKFINNYYYSLQWTEDWTVRFRTLLNLSYIDTDYVGSSRSDQHFTADFEGQYRLNRSLKVLARIGQNQRDSNFNVVDFDRLNVYVGFALSR